MHEEWAELQLRQQSLPPSRENPTLLLGKPEFKASLWQQWPQVSATGNVSPDTEAWFQPQ